MSEEREFRATLQGLSLEDFKKRYLETKESQWREMTRGELHHWMAEIHIRGLVEELEDAVGEIRLTPTRHLVQRGLLDLDQIPTPSPSITTISVVTTDQLKDDEDRKFLEGIARENGGPLTGEMVTALMHYSRPERVKRLTEMANSGVMPIDRDTMRYLGRARQETGVAFDWMYTPPTPSEPEPVTSPVEGTTSKSSGSTGTGASPNAKAPVPGAGPVKARDPQSTGANSGAPSTVENGYGIVAYQRLPLAGKRDGFVAEGFLYVREDLLKSWLRKLTLGKCCPAQRDGLAHHSSGCWLDAVH